MVNMMEAKQQAESVADSLAEVKQSNVLLADQLSEVDAGRKEAFDCLQQDLTHLPAVIWDSMSEERERLISLSKEFDDIVPKVDALEGAIVAGVENGLSVNVPTAVNHDQLMA